MSFIIPTSARIMQIERDKMPDLKENDPVFDMFPEVMSKEWNILIEQWDNISGMQQYRGLNNAPPVVKPLGVRRTTVEPGVYGEHSLLDEATLTKRRQSGTFGAPVDISDLIFNGFEQLASREVVRLRYMMWTLLQTGTYVATDNFNVVGHQLQFTPQTYTASVPWATSATSTPLQDFRTISDLGVIGTSASFDSTSTAYMNRTTFNRLLANTNSADLFGRRTTGLATYNNEDDITKLFLADNLPSIVVVQDNFFADGSTTATRYLTTGKVVIIGKRPPGQKVGMFVMGPNVNNANGAPGRYVRTVDKDITAMGPRSIELHRGMNCVIYVSYPRAIYVMNV